MLGPQPFQHLSKGFVLSHPVFIYGAFFGMSLFLIYLWHFFVCLSRHFILSKPLIFLGAGVVVQAHFFDSVGHLGSRLIMARCEFSCPHYCCHDTLVCSVIWCILGVFVCGGGAVSGRLGVCVCCGGAVGC